MLRLQNGASQNGAEKNENLALQKISEKDFQLTRPRFA